MKLTLSLTSLAKLNFSYPEKELFFHSSLWGSSALLQSYSFQEHLVPGSLREEPEVGMFGSPDLLWEVRVRGQTLPEAIKNQEWCEGREEFFHGTFRTWWCVPGVQSSGLCFC